MNPILRAVILNRLREPSTYAGLVLVIAGALGYQLNDELAAEIAGAVAVIVGAILAVHREKKSPDHPQNRPAPPPFTDVDAPTDRRTHGPVLPQDPPESERPPQGGARERFTHRLRDKDDEP